MRVKAGSTNVTAYFYIVGDAGNTTPGEPVTGLLFSDIETGGSASYMRQGAARVDLTLITQTPAGAHADGGFVEVDATNMPGLYRCDYPDAAFASGVDMVILQLVVAAANNAVVAPLMVEIDGGVQLEATQDNGVTFPSITITGLLDINDGIDVSASTTNRAAINLVGNGTGAGLDTTGGTTGHGIYAKGGASGATDGMRLEGQQLGEGLSAFGGSSGGSGILAQANGGNGSGIAAVSAGSGNAMQLNSSPGTGAALLCISGTGPDIDADITGNLSGSVGSVTANVNADLIPAQSNTVTFPAINITGLLNIDDGIDITVTTANRHAISAVGQGSGSGLRVAGGATGNGIFALSGTSAGNGIRAHAQVSNGIGFYATGTIGTGGIGFRAEGGASGASIDLPQGLVADITGDLSGSVGSNLELGPTEVKAQCDAAIVDVHLDHLFAVDYNPATPPGVATAWANELVESDVGVTRFTANALEQAPSGGGGPTAAAIADAVWDEAQADHVAAGSFGVIASEIAAIQADLDNGTDGLGALLTAINANATPAEVLTQVNAALDTAISELGVGVPSATPSVRTALMLLYMALRNRTDVTTSGADSLEIHNNAGTVIARKALTDAGGDYSEAQMTAGP